jgi:hypothetical protein
VPRARSLPTEISDIGHAYRKPSRATMALCSQVQIVCVAT